MSELIQQVLGQLVRGDRLDEETTEQVFTGILKGDVPAEQIAGLLAMIQQRGATVDELVGAARVMRRFVTTVEAPNDGKPLIDTCGTGGAPKAFNISTAAAIVAASTGKVRVAKHGNRSRTGRGSAEVLGQLGVNLEATPEQEATSLKRVGVCFLYAMKHHPAMVHAGPARRALGFPTLFNLLGPLTNPAGAARQLIGVYDADLAKLVAHALAKLGAERAMVVHGSDGLDEITITGVTIIHEVQAGKVTTWELDPREFGFELAPIERIRMETVEQAADLIRQIVRGADGPAHDVVLLNAAASLVVGGAVPDIRSGIDAARGAIQGGATASTLDQLVSASSDP
ncbi:MAG: anthranilate phosphoribosyltransferase, partial [Planctomycetota bacterium]